MMIAEGDDSESDNLEVNDGMYLDIYLKISKSQKLFFLKLHCPQNDLNIWQNLLRAEILSNISFFLWAMEFQEKLLLRFTDL